MAMMAAVRLSHARCGVFSSRCPVVGIGVCDDGDGMGVPFDDMRERAVLFSSFSSIGAGQVAIWG